MNRLVFGLVVTLILSIIVLVVLDRTSKKDI